MIAGVADTRAAVWYLFGDLRLSARAKDFIDQAAADRLTIEISPISLAEVLYLVENNRLPVPAFDDLRTALDNPKHVFKEAPFTRDVVKAMQQVSREDVRTCRTASSRRLGCISASAATVRPTDSTDP